MYIIRLNVIDQLFHIRCLFSTTSLLKKIASIEQWHTKKAGRIVISVQLDTYFLFYMLHKVT